MYFRDDISLMPVKLAIRAVLLNDMEMLKGVIDDRANVYTVCVPLLFLFKY